MSQHGCPERLSNRSKGFQEDGAGQATMEVLVETLTGTAFEMTVSPSDTVFAIKSKIFRVEGIPVSQQHLVYNLKELEDSASLLALGISDGARLRLVLGMRGGPISTRRLPPPSDLGSELERLLTTNHRYRESSSWSGSSGCKVTVLVFRDGERVNMLRVRENRDGTLQPLDHANSYAVERATATATTSAAEGAAGDNVVTMNKMLELRRRMEALSVRRHQPDNKPEIQKTRSEETLSVPSLLDADCPPYSPYGETDDACMPLYDGHYTRYYDSLFTDRYTLLPPIGSRTDSEQSVDHIPEEGELAGTLAGSILVQRDDTVEAAGDGPAPGAGDGAGAVVLGGGWRTRGFGSSSQLAPPSPSPSPSLAPPSPAPLAAAAHSASTLTLRAPPPLGALFSSSTSDLETLKRNILPLSRYRNREHLHLSDEGLDHTREIGSERRQRRIKKIAELESSRLFRFGDSYEDVAKETDKEEKKDKKIRIRCGFCKKRLSIATVHKCRCGAEFCAPHRYAEVHGCAYDYKANAHQFLTRANPLVSAPKLPKI